MSETEQRIHVGHGGQKLLVPTLGEHRCGTCKFQRQLGGPFGDVFMCLRYPPEVEVLPQIVQVDRVKGPNGQDAIVQRLVEVRNEVRYPPAPDDWSCGEWKPRFTDSKGERLL